MSEQVADLSVQLRADLSDFLHGMRETQRSVLDTKKSLDRGSASVKKLDKSFQQSSKNLASVQAGFAKFQSTLGAIAGVTIGAALGKQLSSLAKNALESADAIGKTADRVGVSVEALQALQFAAERTSGTSEGLTTVLQRITRKIGDVASGSKIAAKAFSDLGVNVKLAGGGLKTTEQVVREISEALFRAGKSQQDMSRLVKLGDTEIGKFIATFRLGSEALGEFARQSRQAGAFTKDMTDRAALLNDRFDVASQTINNSFTRALVDMAPALTLSIELMSKAIVKTHELGVSFARTAGLGADQLTESLRAISNADPSAIINPQVASSIADVSEQLLVLRKQLVALLKEQARGPLLEGQAAELTKIRQELKKINLETEELKLAKELQEQQMAAGEAAEALAKLQAPLKKQVAALTEQKKRFGMSRKEIILYEHQLQSADPKVRALADQIKDLRLELLALETATPEATKVTEEFAESVQNSITALEGKHSAMVAEHDVLRRAIDDWGDSESALEAYEHAQVDAEIASLKIADAAGEHSDALDTLAKKLHDAITKTEELTGAQKKGAAEASGWADMLTDVVGHAIGDALTRAGRTISSNISGTGPGATIGHDIGSAIGGGIGQGLAHGFNAAGSLGAGIATTALVSTFGSTIGTALGSAIPVVGTIIGGLAGSFLGDIIGGLFAPGRIALEKKDIERWFQETTGMLAHATFTPAQGEHFSELEESLHAVGIAYANLSDGGLGTIKRVANLASAAMERNNLTLQEGQALAVHLANSLQLDLVGAIGALNDALQTLSGEAGAFTLAEFVEEVGENQSDLITVGDSLKGIIDILTEFSPHVDQATVANRLLAHEFTDVMETAGLAGERVETLRGQVEAGTIGMEEAFLSLNEELGAALDLSDIRFDTEAIRLEIARIESTLGAVAELGAAVGQLFLDRFADELSGPALSQLTAILDDLLGNALRAAMASAFTGALNLSALQPLFDEFSEQMQGLLSGDISQEAFIESAQAIRSDMLPSLANMSDAMGVAEEQARAIFAALNLSRDSASGLGSALNTAAPDLSNIENFIAAGRQAAGALSSLRAAFEEIRTDIEAVSDQTGDVSLGVDLLARATASFNAQAAELRRDLLEPLQTDRGAGPRGAPSLVPASFDDLGRFRDQSLEAIAARLELSLEGASRATDLFIDSQRKLEQQQLDAVRDRAAAQRADMQATMSDLSTLIQLRGKEATRVRGLVSGLQSLSDSLLGMADTLLISDFNPQPVTLQASLESFRDAFAAGDLEAVRNLARPLLDFAKSEFTTADTAFRDIFAEVQETLRDAAESTLQQASELELQLHALESQTDILGEIRELEHALGVTSETSVKELQNLVSLQQDALDRLGEAEASERAAISTAVGGAIEQREQVVALEIQRAHDRAQNERRRLREDLAQKFDELAGLVEKGPLVDGVGALSGSLDDVNSDLSTVLEDLGVGIVDAVAENGEQITDALAAMGDSLGSQPRTEPGFFDLIDRSIIESLGMDQATYQGLGAADMLRVLANQQQVGLFNFDAAFFKPSGTLDLLGQIRDSIDSSGLRIVSALRGGTLSLPTSDISSPATFDQTAASQGQSQGLSVTIPLQVVTPDGSIVKQQVLRDLRTTSRNGKIVVHANGVGTF